MSRRAWRRPVALLLAYLALSLVMFMSAWRDPAHLSIGVGGDPELFTWLLGWTPFAIANGQNPLLTSYLNYPDGANLMWNTAQVIPGLLLWPVFFLAGPTIAFNVMMTLALPLSGWCAYWAIKGLVPSQVGAAIGGLLYGFSPYMLGHALGHPNFVICLLPPLALLFLFEILVRQKRPVWQPAVLLGVAGTAQLLTGEEILATTALFSALGTVVLLALFPHSVRTRLRHASQGLGIALVVFLVLSAVPIGIQFYGPQRVLGIIRDSDFYVNDAFTFFVPTGLYWLTPSSAAQLSTRWTGNAAEWNGYVGVTLALLLVWTMIRYHRVPVIRWSAVMALLVAVLSMGPHLHVNGHVYPRAILPWALVRNLPIFNDMLPARLSLYFFLFAAVGLAFFVSRLELRPDRLSKLAGWSVVALALLPLIPQLPWPHDQHPVPRFFTGPAVQHIQPGSVMLVAPFTTEPGPQPPAAQGVAADPMLWQSWAGYRFRMPTGYMRIPGPNGETISGPPPSVTQDVMIRVVSGEQPPLLTPQLRRQMARDLESWQVRTVVVGPMPNQAGMVRLFSELLGRAPEDCDGVYVWWHTQDAEALAGGMSSV